MQRRDRLIWNRWIVGTAKDEGRPEGMTMWSSMLGWGGIRGSAVVVISPNPRAQDSNRERGIREI